VCALKNQAGSQSQNFSMKHGQSGHQLRALTPQAVMKHFLTTGHLRVSLHARGHATRRGIALKKSRLPKAQVISYILGAVVGSKHLIAQNEGSTHGNELNCWWHERDLNLRNTSWPALEVIHHFLKLLPMRRCFSKNLATWTSRL